MTLRVLHPAAVLLNNSSSVCFIIWTMARIASVAFVIFFLFSVCCGGQGKISPFVFDSTEWDFGTAKEDGGELVHEYHFTNSGHCDAVIVKVRSLCRCTRAEWPRSPIRPGEKGVIRVIFNPYGYQGKICKGVTVITDSGSEDRLVFYADLVPRKLSMEEEYPVVVNGLLRADRTKFDFRLVQGESKEMSMKFISISDRPLSLSVKPVSGTVPSLSCPDAIEPGQKGELSMVFNAGTEIGDVGFRSGSFLIAVDGKDAVYVDTEMSVTESAPSADGRTAVLKTGGTYTNAGTLSASSSEKVIKYKIGNQGDAVLFIRDIKCPAGFDVTLYPGMSVAPGESLSFDIILHPGQFEEGPVFGTVRIMSNDSSHPIKDIMVAAKIVR